MKLIIGLGNPGLRYQRTRHNLGFITIDALAKKLRASEIGRRWHGSAARARRGGNEIYLLKPGTYMNLSGIAVASAVKELKCPLDDILVICDDLALDLGVIRFRSRGSSGGQKGLQSIIDELGYEDFPRLRLGIGADSDLIPKDFVLEQFSAKEMEIVEKVVEHAVNGVMTWTIRGIQTAMASYNGVVPE